jgi:hypothetical protein
MALTFETLFWGALKLLLLGVGVLYFGLVLMVYRSEGSRIRLRIGYHDPGRSALNLALWLGVKALAGIVYAARTAFDMLSDTSADVGEWYLHHQEHAVHALHRPRSH